MKELACELDTTMDYFMILHRAWLLCGKNSKLEQGAWSSGSLASKEFRIPLLFGWLDSNICYLLGLVLLLPIMHVTAFFAASCSCHWPEAFAQNPALSASQPGLSGPVSGRSSPGAWGTISALLRCSFCLPRLGFPYLVSQCSGPAMSFHSACL